MKLHSENHGIIFFMKKNVRKLRPIIGNTHNKSKFLFTHGWPTCPGRGGSFGAMRLSVVRPKPFPQHASHGFCCNTVKGWKLSKKGKKQKDVLVPSPKKTPAQAGWPKRLGLVRATLLTDFAVTVITAQP